MGFAKTDIFISVIESHKGILYKIANAYCRNSNERQDLVQEMLLQLWNSFDKYNNQYKHSTWIYRIALNVAISFYRKAKTRNNIFSTQEIFNFTGEQENIVNNENSRLLQRFISELKPLDKAMMLLYLEEKSHKEIAEIIGITETNVATKISRVKTLLKNKFSQITT